MGRQQILGLLDLLRYPEGICDIFMSAAIIQTCVFKVCEEFTSFCFWPCDILVDSKMDEVREKNSSNCCYKWLIKETDLSHPREKGKGGRWLCSSALRGEGSGFVGGTAESRKGASIAEACDGQLCRDLPTLWHFCVEGRLCYCFTLFKKPFVILARYEMSS